MKQERHESADSLPLRPREKHGGFKANNKRCSKDLQATVDCYCKFWVKSLNVPRSWDGGVLKYWNTDKYKIRYGLRV